MAVAEAVLKDFDRSWDLNIEKGKSSGDARPACTKVSTSEELNRLNCFVAAAVVVVARSSTGWRLPTSAGIRFRF